MLVLITFCVYCLSGVPVQGQETVDRRLEELHEVSHHVRVLVVLIGEVKNTYGALCVVERLDLDVM